MITGRNDTIWIGAIIDADENILYKRNAVMQK